MSKAEVRPYSELSIPGIGLGLVTGVLLTSAFTYIALKLGFGLAGSTVAAIMGFVVLRGVLRRKSIVENNINQTVASGINTASAGVTFVLPALFLMSVKNPELANFSPWPLFVAAIAGSLMGIVLIIPLRKQMIEFERLKFPSGVATATLLKSPGEGMTQGAILVAGAVIGLVLVLLMEVGIAPEEIDLGYLVGAPAWLPIAIYVSAANIGAGLLSGKGGLPFAAGGILAFWVISPAVVGLGWVVLPETMAVDAVDGYLAGELYGQMLRPLGIGLLIGGALAGVVSSLPALIGAVRSLRAAARVARETGASPEEIDLKWLMGGVVGAFVLLFVAAFLAGDSYGLGTTLLISIVGALWLALAGVIVATATGHTDISPLSGLALIAVTLMYFLTGGDVTAAIVIGVAVCIATNQCADMMSDLKTGHLVGARPRDQQIAQLLLCWVGPLISIAVVYLLWWTPTGDPGFGPDSYACIQGTADCLMAPQAGALQGMVEALQGGDAAVDKYASGAVIGGAMSIFPIGGLAVLIGLAMYLPFSITLSYGLGCLVSMGLEKGLGRSFIGKKLVPFAAGLIVGEALTSLMFAISKILLPYLQMLMGVGEVVQ